MLPLYGAGGGKVIPKLGERFGESVAVQRWKDGAGETPLPTPARSGERRAPWTPTRGRANRPCEPGFSSGHARRRASLRPFVGTSSHAAQAPGTHVSAGD